MTELFVRPDLGSGTAIVNGEIAKSLVGRIGDQPDRSRPGLLALTPTGINRSIEFRGPLAIHPVEVHRRFAPVDEHHVEWIAIRL